MTRNEIEQLADDALNAACLCVQEKLGVASGDVAGMFFSGPVEDEIRLILARYIKSELNWMGTPVDWPCDA
jgi:hypothetical protein